MLSFNYNGIAETTGLCFDNEHDVLMFLIWRLYWLSSHNHNYTSEQRRALHDVEGIIDHLETEGEKE